MPTKSSCDPQNEPQTSVLSFTGVVENFRLKLTKQNACLCPKISQKRNALN